MTRASPADEPRSISHLRPSGVLCVPEAPDAITAPRAASLSLVRGLRSGWILLPAARNSPPGVPRQTCTRLCDRVPDTQSESLIRRTTTVDLLRPPRSWPSWMACSSKNGASPRKSVRPCRRAFGGSSMSPRRDQIATRPSLRQFPRVVLLHDPGRGAVPILRVLGMDAGSARCVSQASSHASADSGGMAWFMSHPRMVSRRPLVSPGHAHRVGTSRSRSPGPPLFIDPRDTCAPVVGRRTVDPRTSASTSQASHHASARSQRYPVVR